MNSSNLFKYNIFIVFDKFKWRNGVELIATVNCKEVSVLTVNAPRFFLLRFAPLLEQWGIFASVTGSV